MTFGAESCFRREKEEEGNGQERDWQATIEEDEVMKGGFGGAEWNEGRHGSQE